MSPVVLVDARGYAGPSDPGELVGLLELAVRTTFESVGLGEGEISLTLLDDDRIRELNREHLGHDRPTDVLAFALWEEGEAVVGDVYVGLDQAARQAAAAGVSLDEELVRLTVHGTLHVLGWDHPEAAARRSDSAMYVRQEAILRRIVSRGQDGAG